ncbi:c-type cytochrome [Cupriavidus respiraculi]|uniref:Cytochrome c domain-containing protein n=1 Tax=Cupriavidus respiraculi TaxID=195930 RepID=A0ABM8X354_9BURK|nr:c-type cytochrome [Cupriavidus respiraculi]CAG9174323.1 hypothetical protein LMG21510_02521 [Cupriavidus respiraculi]
MKRVVRIGLMAVAGLALAAGLVLATGVVLGQRKAMRNIAVDVAPVAYRSDAASLARGQYLYESRGCMECHGTDGRGRVVIDDPGGVFVRATNITAGNPEIARYGDLDWVRAIRHGVAPSGRPLLIMPSEDYNQLSDEDLGAVIAYVRSLPPGNGAEGDGRGEVRLPLLVRALYGYGKIPDAAEKIDHGRPPSPPLAPAPTAAYGAYVANACIGCHGANLAGGKIPGAPPDWPPAADLRPGAVMLRYGTPERFIAMMRTGMRPNGSPVSKVMPFESLAKMSDTDLTALYLHLKALPVTQASR